MSRFDELQIRVKSWFSTRAISNGPNDPIWMGLSGNMQTASGKLVNPEMALRASAVFACIRVLSETIASIPLKLYRRSADGGKQIAQNHYLYPILHDAPHPFLTSYEFREMLVAHLNLRGNFYAIKQYDEAGNLTSLIPLNPANMKVMGNEFGIMYEYQWKDKKAQTFLSDEIWHVRGLSTDGLVGHSPVTLARESIGLYLATEEHGARLFSNGARPGGALRHPGKLKEETAIRLRANWESAHAGSANAHRVAILEEGLEWQTIGMNAEDSQFIEARNFQVEDIARIFRVPSVLIGHPDKNSTYASAEQFFLSFVVHTIRPWVTRLEQSINRNLLTEKERKKYFAEFQMDGLLRGDIKSRYEAYAIGRTNKWLSANEVRGFENLNPIEGGDKYENPNTTSGNDKPTDKPKDKPTELDDGTT